MKRVTLMAFATLGLCVSSAMGNEDYTTFMGIFKIKDGTTLVDLLFCPNDLKKYDETSACYNAALRLCLAPASFVHHAQGAWEAALCDYPPVKVRIKDTMLHAGASIVMPCLFVFNSAEELVIGNHVSIAHSLHAKDSNIAQSTIMNTYDLW